MKTFFLILFTSITVHHNYAQNIFQLDKRVEYFSETDTLDILGFKGKGHYPRAQRARELIILDENTAILESCFYYDGRRFNHQNHNFTFYVDDSIVKVSTYGHTETWAYEQISDTLFKIKKTLRNVTEIGYAKHLVPLEKFGTFYVINPDKDTTYSIEYKNYISPRIIDIFSDTCLNSYPNCKNESKIFQIGTYLYKWSNFMTPILRVNSIITGLAVIEFSITEKGEVCNFKFRLRGANDFHNVAVLNTLEEEKFKELISNIGPCRVQIPIRQEFN